jgi:hypothetical protein
MAIAAVRHLICVSLEGILRADSSASTGGGKFLAIRLLNDVDQ